MLGHAQDSSANPPVNYLFMLTLLQSQSCDAEHAKGANPRLLAAALPFGALCRAIRPGSIQYATV
jgi:hypothetical protein